MKVPVYSIDGKKLKEIELPSQFYEEYRPDLIKRAVLAIQSHKRQPYGASPEAGKRHSAKLSRRRRAYKGAYGLGISRVPRKTMWRRGMHFGWVGAVAPGTVGGRRAHPPKAEKVWDEKINKKEKRKAIRSALATTKEKELLAWETAYEGTLPIVIEDKFEELTKTKDVEKVFEALNLSKELERASKKKVRAGRGKLRGRRYKKKKGPLIVVSKRCKLIKSADNLPGVDIAVVNNLNAELLAPGLKPRLTIFTEQAIKKLKEENLFYDKK